MASETVKRCSHCRGLQRFLGRLNTGSPAGPAIPPVVRPIADTHVHKSPHVHAHSNVIHYHKPELPTVPGLTNGRQDMLHSHSGVGHRKE